MSRDLRTLIRLHAWEVDQKRRQLGQLLRKVEDLDAQAAALEREMAGEQEVVRSSPIEAGVVYADYAQAAIARRDHLAELKIRAELEVDAARDDLRHAYQDLRKYELAQEARDRRATRERERRERIQMDDVGVERFRRERRKNDATRRT